MGSSPIGAAAESECLQQRPRRSDRIHRSPELSVGISDPQVAVGGLNDRAVADLHTTLDRGPRTVGHSTPATGYRSPAMAVAGIGRCGDLPRGAHPAYRCDPKRRTSPATTVKVSAYAVTASRDRQCAEMPVRSSRSDGKVLGTLRSTPSIRAGSSKSWRCSRRRPPRTR